MVPTAEARACKVQINGHCISDESCQRSCFKAGYGGGDCKGLHRHCICLIKC
ncbi:Defensin-like protein [Apostasia shenzhenica]|uniref:Defensin-like protein n=1 Tax=Apostasia shenzhenica TaxID=1088818 RepID=A0A2I0A9L1_9ASPA|nr:Defensin-like protein [Apostasia shenzhenica]